TGGIAATTILSAAAIGLPRQAQAAIPPFRRKVGAIEVMAISDGTLEIPLSFTFPETPAPEVSSLLSAYGLSPAGPPMQTHGALLTSAADIIRVDAGSGRHFQPTAGRLSESVEAAGIGRASVRKGVFTHGRPAPPSGVREN